MLSFILLSSCPSENTCENWASKTTFGIICAVGQNTSLANIYAANIEWLTWFVAEVCFGEDEVGRIQSIISKGLSEVLFFFFLSVTNTSVSY